MIGCSDSQLKQVPIRVRWAGWESDTYVLRNNQWEVWAGQQRVMYADELEVSMSLKAPDNKLMLFGKFRISRRMLMDSPNGLLEVLRYAGVQMQGYKSEDRVMVYPENNFGSWNSLESLQRCDGFAAVDMSGEYRELSELKLFNFKDDSKEILIPEKSVDGLLNHILQIQYPKQVELAKSDKAIERPRIQAKIYSLAA